MTKAITIFLFLLLPFQMFGQHVAMACDAVNVFYEGVANPISVVVENRNSGDLIVETDNGTLQKKGSCEYWLDGLKAGFINLTIKTKEENKVIVVGKQKFNVKAIPLPVASVGGLHVGEIKKPILLAQVGIVARMDGFDFDASFKVTKFEVTIIRKGAIILNKSNVGNRFDDELKNGFQLVEMGDIVLFENIFCIRPDKREKALESVELTIIP